MHVAALRFPGSFIQGQSAELSQRAFALCWHTATCLADAAIALTWFEANAGDYDLRAEHETASRLRVEALELPQHEVPNSRTLDDAQVLKYALSKGFIPRAYRQRYQFIHARTFLFALDGIEKSLGTLVQVGVESLLQNELEDLWKQSFPQVRAVRNSAHHLEDRMRGLGPRGRPLELMPVSNALVEAPSGGALINESLIGNSYVTTIETGECAEVEVSANSLFAASDVCQSMLEVFSWIGPPLLHPMI